MDQRDSHCPYSLSSEITAKPTVLGLVLVCKLNSVTWINLLLFNIILNVRATAGQEDPFELDSNLLLSSGRHGEDCKRQYFMYDHETPLLDDLADLLYYGIALRTLFLIINSTTLFLSIKIYFYAI